MTNPVAGRYVVAYNGSVGEHVDFDGLAALVRARQLLLDRLTRRLVLVAHGVEAGGWSEAPLRVRVVGVADG